MIDRQLLLVQREVWEHKALYAAPIAVAGLIVFALIASFITAMAQGVPFEVGVATLQMTGAPVSITGGGALLAVPFWSLDIVLAVVVFLYGIDALYAERKDKSILFWRSMPVTDTETVISKLITGVIAAPLITGVIIVATQILSLALASVAILVGGGNPVELLLGPLPFVDVWMLVFWVLITSSLWLAPVMAWFLLCSAFAKRSVLVWVFIPWIVLGILDSVMDFGSFKVWSFIGTRIGLAPIVGLDVPAGINGLDEDTVEALISSGSVDILSVIAPGKFLAEPGLWGGLIVAAAFTAGAIYCRRFRS